MQKIYPLIFHQIDNLVLTRQAARPDILYKILELVKSTPMLLLNISHPLTDAQRAQVQTLAGQPITETRYIPVQFDNAQPYPEQVRVLVDSINLTPEEWQTLSILVNPPAYNFAAMTLLAELHGRIGYFPAIVRIRPVPESTPPRYEVAEIINLQTVRDAARTLRTK
jgi:hypothetical protein